MYSRSLNLLSSSSSSSITLMVNIINNNNNNNNIIIKSIKNLCIFRNLCMKYHVIVRSYMQQTSRDFSSVCHFDPQNIYAFSLDEIILEFYELDSSSMLEDFCLQDPSVSIVVKQGTTCICMNNNYMCTTMYNQQRTKIKCFDQWVTMSQLNTTVCIN